MKLKNNGGSIRYGRLAANKIMPRLATTRPLQPYEKICHLANKINDKGQASALCFDPPRAINLKNAKYVMTPESLAEVTCRKCNDIFTDLELKRVATK